MGFGSGFGFGFGFGLGFGLRLWLGYLQGAAARERVEVRVGRGVVGLTQHAEYGGDRGEHHEAVERNLC